MLRIINKILDRFKKKPELVYPSDFIMINYSPIALQNNIKDDQNKLIYRYLYDDYGNQIVKEYAYSPQKVFCMQEVLRIPVVDMTKHESRFPVFSRISPSEIEFTSKK